ncbi:MAG: hypothetical protein HC911_18065 [Chloroflexaceae bacterium]|nr:hypothetical protein [Chloroflexaceae bacterium]
MTITELEAQAAAAMERATQLCQAWQDAMWAGKDVQAELLYAAWQDAERVRVEAERAADAAQARQGGSQ